MLHTFVTVILASLFGILAGIGTFVFIFIGNDQRNHLNWFIFSLAVLALVIVRTLLDLTNELNMFYIACGVSFFIGVNALYVISIISARFDKKEEPVT